MRDSKVVRLLPKVQLFDVIKNNDRLYQNHVSVVGYFSAEFFGSFGFDNLNWGFLYVDPGLKVSGLKEGEVALRYYTERMVAAGDKSFIVCVVNVNNGMFYFIKDRSIEHDNFLDRYDYEGRGVKLKFLNICE